MVDRTVSVVEPRMAGAKGPDGRRAHPQGGSGGKGVQTPAERISNNLRRVYGEIADQPIPEAWLELLNKIPDEREESS